VSDKRRFLREKALLVARFLCIYLADHCVRIEVAGSLRRRKAEVGDIELVFIPDMQMEPVDFFTTNSVSCVDKVLEDMIRKGILAKRLNVRGGTAWGERNKLALHVESGIPVDLFAATSANWFNYLVCRTGPGESNIRIATAAQAKGWKWNPYGDGFSRPAGLGREIHPVKSEREVFEFVGLEYKEPWERV
jgi:DNA polymerase/3'-5' exonuclease PolX